VSLSVSIHHVQRLVFRCEADAVTLGNWWMSAGAAQKTRESAPLVHQNVLDTAFNPPHLDDLCWPIVALLRNGVPFGGKPNA
jgi:hypothetical protein